MNVKLIAHTPNPLYVCAEAAAVCYDSEPDLRIIKGCIKSGHCYDAETEVLTDNGFINWKDVNYNTKLANVDPKTREFVGFYNPITLISYPYNGKMIKFENKYIDLNITPGHKIYCSLSNTAYKRTHPNFSLMEANRIISCSNSSFDKEVYKKPLRMTTNAINKRNNNGNPIYKLYGFFIGDGYCESDNSKICFHLKKERKINFLQEICKDCELQLEHGEGNRYRIKIDNFRTMFYNDNKEKTFPNNFYQMSKQDFDFFFEGLINSDGTIGKTSMEYSTSSKELKDKLSALFSINGLMFTVGVNPNSEKNKNWKDIYKITIALKNKDPMFNDSRSKYYAKEVEYSGMVYCAETETGLLIVRRNGKIALCGNCSVLEHCTFTFKIEGISRTCSH